MTPALPPAARALHIGSAIVFGLGMAIGFAGTMLLIASAWLEGSAIDHEGEVIR